ncbi:MAG: redoxin family protein [Rhodanobacteraceae bacterium]
MLRHFLSALAAIALLGTAVSTPGFAESASMQQAPEFAGISKWINSPPLTMQQLRGKVVLIDFWAYSCINCLRTLPHVTHWYDTYKNKSLVVVGVHTPEFDFGKNPTNVERAVKHFGIHYPVAMDNGYQTWNAWHNQFWPAEYLVNRAGEVVLTHIGEGNYAEMENAIRKQLGLQPLAAAAHGSGTADLARIGSPEMYFGSDRVRNLANPAENPQRVSSYRTPASLPLNQFALQGRWRLTGKYAELSGPHGEIHLHFHSGKVYMVASSESPVTLSISVDGKPQPPVTVQASKMYTLFDSNDYRDHTIVIRIPKPGLHAFTFTFG